MINPLNNQFSIIKTHFKLVKFRENKYYFIVILITSNGKL